MKKIDKNHRLDYIFGYTGYSLLLIQGTLLISFTVAAVSTYIAKLAQPEQDAVTSLEAYIQNPYLSPNTVELPLEQKLALVIIGFLLSIFTIYFVGKHSSNILKRILGRLYKKPKTSSLFFAKILIITISFLFIVILLLALPTFATLLPVITGGSVVAIVCFSIQHLMARRGKMPYKKIA